jgi:uncharacterized protein (DUF305 family)
MKTLLSLVVTTTLLASPAFAGKQCHMSGMHGMSHSAVTQDKKTVKLPQVAAYIAANEAMHKGMNISYTGDSDIDFVEGMIPHHQGAIDMAKVQLQYGKDESLKELAKRIITAQEAEIGMMNAWINGRRSAWKAENLNELESVKGYKDAMKAMHKDMDIVFTGDADVDFARGMIPHHQGAVAMAVILKKTGRDAMLRDLADDVIRGQAQEIKMMQEWLAAHPVVEAPKPVVKKKKAKTSVSTVAPKKADAHAHH